MWFRALLIMLLIYLVARYVGRVLRPQNSERQVRGNVRPQSGRFEESRIKDATFKDLPDK